MRRFTNPEDAKGHLERAEPSPRGQSRWPGRRQGRTGHRLSEPRPNHWVEQFVGRRRPVVIEGLSRRPGGQRVCGLHRPRSRSLAPARDYKRLLAVTSEPNTGGMGAYSPVDDLPTGLVDVPWSRDRTHLAQMTEAETRLPGLPLYRVGPDASPAREFSSSTSASVTRRPGAASPARDRPHRGPGRGRAHLVGSSHGQRGPGRHRLSGVTAWWRCDQGTP